MGNNQIHKFFTNLFISMIYFYESHKFIKIRASNHNIVVIKIFFKINFLRKV